MNQGFREKQRRNIITTRMIYDITMSVVFLGVGIVMFLAPYIRLDYVTEMDATMRVLFGGLCLLYGSFRLYRAVNKKDY